jgi:hypothetical protein
MEKDKCDFCSKNAKYYTSERKTTTTYNIKTGNEIDFTEDEQTKNYCKKCAEDYGII